MGHRLAPTSTFPMHHLESQSSLRAGEELERCAANLGVENPGVEDILASHWQDSASAKQAVSPEAVLCQS